MFTEADAKISTAYVDLFNRWPELWQLSRLSRDEILATAHSHDVCFAAFVKACNARGLAVVITPSIEASRAVPGVYVDGTNMHDVNVMEQVLKLPTSKPKTTVVTTSEPQQET